MGRATGRSERGRKGNREGQATGRRTSERERKG